MMYNRKLQENVLGKIVDYAIHQLRELDLSDKAKEQFWEQITTPLLVCGAFFKDPGYASEQEWRVWKLTPDRSTAAERPSPDGTKIGMKHCPLKKSLCRRLSLGLSVKSKYPTPSGLRKPLAFEPWQLSESRRPNWSREISHKGQNAKLGAHFSR
jgi:hypothetical protein